MTGFTIDRSLSDGLNPYNEGERNVGGAEDCILNRKITEMGAAGAGIIRFVLKDCSREKYFISVINLFILMTEYFDICQFGVPCSNIIKI